jgi:hypothetical protein
MKSREVPSLEDGRRDVGDVTTVRVRAQRWQWRSKAAARGGSAANDADARPAEHKRLWRHGKTAVASGLHRRGAIGGAAASSGEGVERGGVVAAARRWRRMAAARRWKRTAAVRRGKQHGCDDEMG